MSDSLYLVCLVKISYLLWYSYESESIPNKQISDIYLLYEFVWDWVGEGELVGDWRWG